MNRKLQIASLVVFSLAVTRPGVSARDSFFERLFSGGRAALGELFPAAGPEPAQPLAAKTWDGGGATNNWSEAANWSDDTVPAAADDVTFDATSAKNAVIDVDITVRTITIGAGYTGTLTQAGASAIAIDSNGFGAFTQNGGTFDGGAGDITLTGDASSNHDFRLTGGTFNSTSGTLFLARSFRHITGGTFNANGGTVTFNDAQNVDFITSASPAGDTFNNLVFGKNDGREINLTGKAIVAGSLTLGDGRLTSDGGSLSNSIEARGALAIAPDFDGGASRLIVANGSGPRTITLTAGVNYPNLVLDDPQATVETAGAGPLLLPKGFVLQQGTFNQGNVDLSFLPSFDTPICYQQSGGTFNGGSRPITFTTTPNSSAAFKQTGGTFNGGSGDITLTGVTNSIRDFVLSGGTFVSTSGTLTVIGFFRHQNGGTFNANGGTVAFNGPDSAEFYSPNDTFNNLIVEKTANAGVALNGVATVAGQLSLVDGSLDENGSGTLQAAGDTTIAATFDGGNAQFAFTGPANQTFTNQGAPGFSNTWFVNKTGGTVNLGSDLDLSSGTNPLFLTSGTITTGPNFTVNTAQRTIQRTNGYVSGNLRKNFATTGTKTYDVGTANGYRPVTANVTALAAGTQGLTIGEFEGAHPNLDPATSLARYWRAVEHGDVTATLAFGYFETDVHGLETNYRFAEIDGVVNFFSNAAVPINRTANSFTLAGVTDFKSYSLGEPHLTAAPANASVVVAQTRILAGAGAVEPYAYSLPTNNSGGSINPTTGLYTAGTLAGVVDTVRVTDAENRIFDSTVTVLPDAPAKVAFTVQPANSQSGSPIGPAVRAAIRDRFDNLVTTAADPVTVAIAANPAGGTLSGTLTQNAAGGVATFGDLAIDRAGNGYTLAAVSGSLTAGTSSPFNVVGPFRLAFVAPPANTQNGLPITPPVQVAVQDQFGNTVGNATNAVTVAIGNNPAGGALSGTLTRNADGGAASFDDLTIDRIGTGYTLSAASPPLLPAVSGAFNIEPATAVTNTNDSGTGSLRQAILNANAAPGIQTIAFDIPGGGPFTIAPTTVLPAVTDPAVIDGTTQPEYAGAPVIRLDGSHTLLTGLKIECGDTVVKGLSLTNFSIAIAARTGDNKIFSGNWIGIAPGGSQGPNGQGLLIRGQNNTIGGLTPAARNVISGSQFNGIQLDGASDSTIAGNYIGTNETGTAAFGNAFGIQIINDSHGNSIQNNIVSGNGTAVQVGGGLEDPTSDNAIEDNLIGLDRFGTPMIPNLQGIRIFSGTGNRMSRNRISGNGQLGISVGFPTDTPSINDPFDLDFGPNNLQNYPTLIFAENTGGGTTVSGIFNSRPTQNDTLEFFSSPSCDASGNGEGETFVGSTHLTTDADGLTGFSATLSPAVPDGWFITATATDASGNTSEFSNCQIVSAHHFIDGRITNGAQPAANVILNLTGTGISSSTLTDSDGYYSFNPMPEGLAPYSVTPTAGTLNFSPAGRSYPTFFVNQADQDYAATPKNFALSGQIKSVFNGVPAPLAGVTVNLSGAAGRTALTDANGKYRFTNVAPGSYTVTPTKTNFAFNPTSVPVNVGADQNLDFTALIDTQRAGRIVFTRDRGNLYGMNADGSGVTLLQPPANTQSSIVFDGKRVLMMHNNSICFIKYDGSGLSCLNNPGFTPGYPALSPDGNRILFVKTLSREIYTANSDGTGVARIFRESDDVSFPYWSPDGTKILYSGQGNALISINSDGTNRQVIAPNILGSDLSPDGSKIIGSDGLGNIVMLNADGTGRTVIISANANDSHISRPAWSPDGQNFVFTRLRNNVFQVVTAKADGGHQTIIYTSTATTPGLTPDWQVDPAGITNTGPNVAVGSGAVTVSFGLVSAAGQTSVIPISPSSAGATPHGFSIGSFGAYEIVTTATVAPPITVCVNLPASVTQAQLGRLSFLHNEGGTLVDRTVSRDFPTRQICASVSSLSPFVVAEAIEPLQPSISGVVRDADGDPLGGVLVELTGAENRTAQTDSDGLFMFPNLTAGADYNVRPREIGYLFDEYSRDFVDLTGENPVVFTGTAGSFQIAGRVKDAAGNGVGGVKLALDDDPENVVFTDAAGNYGFANLPADGNYRIRPSNNSNSFAPSEASLNALTGDFSGVDFTMLAPTAAGVSVSGRVTDANGAALPHALVSMTGPDGAARSVRTNSFGYYAFDDVAAGETYVIEVRAKDRRFRPRVVGVAEDLEGLDFEALP